MTDNGNEILAAGGWCAPSSVIYQDYLSIWDPAGIGLWPMGLTAEDLDWLAEHLALAEVDPDLMAFPFAGIRRGGITFPLPGTAAIG